MARSTHTTTGSVEGRFTAEAQPTRDTPAIPFHPTLAEAEWWKAPPGLDDVWLGRARAPGHRKPGADPALCHCLPGVSSLQPPRCRAESPQAPLRASGGQLCRDPISATATGSLWQRQKGGSRGQNRTGDSWGHVFADLHVAQASLTATEGTVSVSGARARVTPKGRRVRPLWANNWEDCTSRHPCCPVTRHLPHFLRIC